MNKRFFLFAAVIFGIILSSLTYAAAPLYEGQTIRIIVGLAPGGGFDITARAVARHLGKHIPGNPTIVVENMTGAGSLISANYLYRRAEPSGFTIGYFTGGLFFNQALGQPGIEFDARKFEYIGAVSTENYVAFLTKRSGITSIDKWTASKTPVKMGGLIAGNTVDTGIRILKGVLGLPIQLVSGYKGNAEVRLAIESGELSGGLFAWPTLKAIWGNALKTGEIVVLLQAVPKPLRELPNVPLMMDLAKNEEARKVIQTYYNSTEVYSRPFVLPPGTPKERVYILRKALQETLKDEAFLKDAEKTKVDLSPATGEEIERAVADIFQLEPRLLTKMKEIVYK